MKRKKIFIWCANKKFPTQRKLLQKIFKKNNLLHDKKIAALKKDTTNNFRSEKFHFFNSDSR